MAPTGKFADYLIEKEYISKLTSRKLFSGIGNYGPALGLVWLSFVGCNRVMAVLALCTCVGLDAAGYSGFFVSHSAYSFWQGLGSFVRGESLNQSSLFVFN